LNTVEQFINYILIDKCLSSLEYSQIYLPSDGLRVGEKGVPVSFEKIQHSNWNNMYHMIYEILEIN